MGARLSNRTELSRQESHRPVFELSKPVDTSLPAFRGRPLWVRYRSLTVILPPLSIRLTGSRHPGGTPELPRFVSCGPYVCRAAPKWREMVMADFEQALVLPTAAPFATTEGA